MWKQKLALLAGESFGLSVSELIPMIRAVGFEGFFAVWKGAACMQEWATIANDGGL